MNAPLRWGIIGAGRIAAEFAHGLISTQHSVVAKIASRHSASAAGLARELGNCEAVEGLNDIIASKDIDVVYIATPNATHAQLAVESLNADKHVLIEKPIAVTAAEARQVAEVATRRQRFCMEALWTRFLPIATEVKRLVNSGAIGTIGYVHAELGEPITSQEDPAGGALLDLGVYPLSMVQWLLGQPLEVLGTVQPGTDGRSATRAAAMLVFEKALASIAASHEARLANTLIIAGDRGRIEIEAPFFRSMRCRIESYEMRAPLPRQTVGGRGRALKDALIRTGLLPSARAAARNLLGHNGRLICHPYTGYGYQYEADEVARCITAGLNESPVMPLSDSVAVMEIVDRIREK